jgi:hypothetical protein
MLPIEAAKFLQEADEKDVDVVLRNCFTYYYTNGLTRGFLYGLVVSTLFWLVVLVIKYIL